MLRRVRPRTGTASGEDRFSALPDDLIHLIVRRLDTRTALSMAVLARRWAHIPHDLPELDFRVSDVLPPEYHRTVALRRRNMPRDTFLAETLDRLMARCEIDTISAFVDGITGLLEADGGPTDGDPRRRAKTLRLEFFQTHDGGYVVDRLIATAVGAWGVKDLEVVARQASCDVLQAPPYCFPHDHDCLKDGLRSLTLGNYRTLPPLHSYNALTTLVLKDMAASTPVGVYQRVFTECTRLQVLHLISCCCAQDCVTVDAPCSEIKELILDQCKFMAVELLHLPMLVSLACCLTDTCRIVFGSVPSLMHTNLTFATESWIVPQRCRALRSLHHRYTPYHYESRPPIHWAEKMDVAQHTSQTIPQPEKAPCRRFACQLEHLMATPPPDVRPITRGLLLEQDYTGYAGDDSSSEDESSSLNANKSLGHNYMSQDESYSGNVHANDDNDDYDIDEQSYAESETQDHQEPSATYEDLMIDNMIAQMPIPRVVEQRPLPSSSFLNATQLVLNQSLDGQGSQASSSTIRPGELAQKLEAMKNQRDRELDERKQAILASRREEELMRAEEVARKKHEVAQKKAELAERRRLVAAQTTAKKKEEEEINKKAQAETREIIQDTMKTLAAEKKGREEAERRAAAQKKGEEKRA
ncbi:hypothetical protein ZWY2020_006466 [Hordeum vulgare]|nr:hypothetical protein ZWY2020_006466 [Hordeum vulgare]